MAYYDLRHEGEDIDALLDKADAGELVEKKDLSEVATSGDYNDLENKPNIPAEVTKQTVVDWGFGTYTKPNNGIPASDLDPNVFLQGEKGDKGENGATFTPSVDSAGNLSWTNDKGLPNPATVNIKGPKGDSWSGGGGIPDLEEVLAPRNVGVVDTTTEIDDTIPFATTDYVNSAIASAITQTINADY